MSKAGLIELNAVAAVAAHRNFRAAAIELGLSASAISHAISGLEARLGVRLFHRTTRSVALTEAGEAFLARVQPALREIAQALEAVNDHRTTPTGTLRLNTSAEAARRMMIPYILPFLQRYPDMKLDIVSEGRLVDIVAEGFDAGIRLAEAVPLDMIAVPFGGDVSFAVVGSPDYFATRPQPRTPVDLAKHVCIRARMPSGTLYRWEFEHRGETLSVEVTGPLTLDNHGLMREAALAGAGLAYISEGMVEADLAEGRLIRVLADWTPPFSGLCLYYPSHRHVPAGLRAFVSLLRERRGA